METHPPDLRHWWWSRTDVSRSLTLWFINLSYWHLTNKSSHMTTFITDTSAPVLLVSQFSHENQLKWELKWKVNTCEHPQKTKIMNSNCLPGDEKCIFLLVLVNYGELPPKPCKNVTLKFENINDIYQDIKTIICWSASFRLNLCQNKTKTLFQTFDWIVHSENCDLLNISCDFLVSIKLIRGIGIVF